VKLQARSGYADDNDGQELYERMCENVGLMPIGCGTSSFLCTDLCIPMPSSWGCNMMEDLYSNTGWNNIVAYQEDGYGANLKTYPSGNQYLSESAVLHAVCAYNPERRQLQEDHENLVAAELVERGSAVINEVAFEDVKRRRAFDRNDYELVCTTEPSVELFSEMPSAEPSQAPVTLKPTVAPATSTPTITPTEAPTLVPTNSPTDPVIFEENDVSVTVHFDAELYSDEECNQVVEELVTTTASLLGIDALLVSVDHSCDESRRELQSFKVWNFGLAVEKPMIDMVMHLVSSQRFQAIWKRSLFRKNVIINEVGTPKKLDAVPAKEFGAMIEEELEEVASEVVEDLKEAVETVAADAWVLPGAQEEMNEVLGVEVHVVLLAVVVVVGLFGFFLHFLRKEKQVGPVSDSVSETQQLRDLA